MPEKEVKFRRGESTGRPLGGKVSSEPFPQALYALAKSRGFESQLSLAKTLGFRGNSQVQTWYSGKSAPLPEYFGTLLILFQPNDEELDSIVEPYGQLLQEGKAVMGSLAHSEKAILAGQKNIKAGLTPFDSWVEQYCRDHKTSIRNLRRNLSEAIGFVKFDIRHADTLGIYNYSQVLQKAPEVLNLSEQETDSLSEAVAQTLEAQFAKGRKFRSDTWPRGIILLQKQLTCRTFTSNQAGRELGITGQRVRQLRDKLSLPYLLTEEHIVLLRNRRKQGK